jgi:hypothetical protein
VLMSIRYDISITCSYVLLKQILCCSCQEWNFFFLNSWIAIKQSFFFPSLIRPCKLRIIGNIWTLLVMIVPKKVGIIIICYFFLVIIIVITKKC